MCGRFTQPGDWQRIAELIPGLTGGDDTQLRFNVAPSQMIPVVLNDGALRLTHVKWGLVPFWAEDPSIGNRLINARAEGIETKPSFRRSLRTRRCLIIADGFYEWGAIAGKKTPVHFRLRDNRAIAIAGLWDEWRPKGDREAQPLRTATIITTSANELVGRIHHRMPVILDAPARQLWLSPEEREPAELLPLLRPYPADPMTATAVSTDVNSPFNEGPHLLTPQQSDLFG